MIITTETEKMNEQVATFFITAIRCCQLLLMDIEKYDFAARAFKLGYLDKDAMLTMKLRLEQTEEEQDFTLSKSDIINLYTWADIAAKFQLTQLGDDTIVETFDSEEVKDAIKTLLEISSGIIDIFNKNCKDDPEFEERKKKLTELKL